MLCTHPTLDRSKLDALLSDARAKLAARDAIERPCSPQWLAAHRLASEAFGAASEERRRLWRAERWGAWMSPLDRELARITGEL